MKPLLTVKHRETTIFPNVHTKKKALLKLIETLNDDLNGHELRGVFVPPIHCGAEGDHLASPLDAELNTTVLMQSIRPVIGCSVGPGRIGIAYFVK